MLVQFDNLLEPEKERLKRTHPRGHDIFNAILENLKRTPTASATKLPNGQWLKIFTPDIQPATEIRLCFLEGGERVLVKKFAWEFVG